MRSDICLKTADVHRTKKIVREDSQYMNVFEIIGPIMIGPSSSHTAGAVKIGFISRQLMREEIQSADIFLHGSFLATGKGHGTDRALVAGLLGMKADDVRIPDSFRYADQVGLRYHFSGIELKGAHPNTVLLKLRGVNGRELEVVAASLGGGVIKICQIDGLEANIGACYPTLIVHNVDQPGHVFEVTSMLGHKSVNIAAMQLYRDKRGGNAVMVIECDQEIPLEALDWLRKVEGIVKVTYLSMEEQNEF